MAVMIWTWRRGAAILNRQDAAHRGAAEGPDQEPRETPAPYRQGHRGVLTSDPNFVPTALFA